MTRPIFDQIHSKTSEITFTFPEFVPHAKNQFIPSIHSWDSQFYSPITRLTIPISDYAHPKNFWSTFMQICINMQKIRMFHWFVLEIWLIKKSYNLNGWEYFGPYLRKQNFPKYEICAETPNSINFH